MTMQKVTFVRHGDDISLNLAQVEEKNKKEKQEKEEEKRKGKINKKK